MAALAPLPGIDVAERFARVKDLPAVVVLAGEEPFLAEEAIAAIGRALFPDGEPAGAAVHLDATVPVEAERIPSVLEELATPSLFGEGKLVVIRHAEAIGGPAASFSDDLEEAAAETEPAAGEGEAVASGPKAGGKGGRRASPITTLVKQAMAAPVAGAVLVLATRKPVRGKGSVSAEALQKAGAALVDCRRLYDAPPPWSRGGSPFDTEVAKWVARRAKARHGKSMDPRTAQALALRVGASLSGLAKALETLSSYVGERGTIAEADVAATVGESREDPSWVLADAVLEREVDKSLGLVAAAFDRGLSDAKGRVAVRPEAIFPPLVAALHGAWRRLMLVAEAGARGESPASLPALAGLPSFVVERVLRQAARRSPDDLRRRHRAFLEAEAGVRGGGAPPRLALERLVVQLAR